MFLSLAAECTGHSVRLHQLNYFLATVYISRGLNDVDELNQWAFTWEFNGDIHWEGCVSCIDLFQSPYQISYICLGMYLTTFKMKEQVEFHSESFTGSIYISFYRVRLFWEDLYSYLLIVPEENTKICFKKVFEVDRKNLLLFNKKTQRCSTSGTGASNYNMVSSL